MGGTERAIDVDDEAGCGRQNRGRDGKRICVSTFYQTRTIRQPGQDKEVKRGEKEKKVSESAIMQA